MKLWTIGILLSICSHPVLGQGTVLFDNRVPGIVDARWSFGGGAFFGAGWTAQLFGGPETNNMSALLPLFPATTFNSSTSADMGYVNPVVVTVPGVPSGGRASLQMRAGLDGASGCVAIGNLLVVTLGGGASPPAYLTGLRELSFLPDFACIPEPSIVALIVLGAGALIFFDRKSWHL